jgi:flagellar biosynthesis/type III secretory pathway protein FliH
MERENEWNKFLATVEVDHGIIVAKVLNAMRKSFEAGYEAGYEEGYNDGYELEGELADDMKHVSED